MTDATKEKTEPVRWVIAGHPHACCECGAPISRGEKFAHWVEILAGDSYGKHARVPRDYCEPCGRLLEDSLTTTEMVS
jgi:hypothetical protein